MGALARHRVFRHREAVGLLTPYDPKALTAWPVSRQVNAPKNQGPELIEEEGSGAAIGA